MGKSRKDKNKIKVIRYITVFIIIFILFFLRTSYKYYKKGASDVVEAGNLSESILLMSEKSAVNLALQHEKQLIQAEKAKLAELEKRQQKELDQVENRRNVFLTFDDGPSEKVTPQILDILKKYDVKATFFVIGSSAEKYPEIIKRIHQEGHAIGNHTYSHRYNYIYRRTSNFLKELENTEKVLKGILGEDYETKLVRFPGGSFGEKKAPFRKAVLEKGYTYYDWNSLNGDAEGHYIPKDRLIQRFKSTYNGQKELIILMHDMDSKYTTSESLPYIIEYLQQNDYEFQVLR
ncbi:Polysaccharide deacetylase family protein [[Clostridium] ultunense Esp]|uniref:Polysaccharide deacetylase family protein n=1 Tax=[Clostridium] ultunense Esp TaxID=1288971 RepID=M1ZHM4_9FIRM|nr:polysaccharide deacetylase family protein [Schnuerera ultunensis]CCQ97843.1 Polysaccharide deacetylase family protein [[Clostridium] ultunense Esp]SHD77641.1 Polysaccharide deacetylase family protein [[Clostridium] ultunense Esp]